MPYGVYKLSTFDLTYEYLFRSAIIITTCFVYVNRKTLRKTNLQLKLNVAKHLYKYYYKIEITG